MQDWRFDDLTRSLGKATSRRQVFKGLLAGIGATLVDRAVPRSAVAAMSCSSSQYQTCASDATDKFQASKTVCAKSGGGGYAVAACQAVAVLTYEYEMKHCRRQYGNCPPGSQCVDDRCCRGADCCQSGHAA